MPQLGHDASHAADAAPTDGGGDPEWSRCSARPESTPAILAHHCVWASMDVYGEGIRISRRCEVADGAFAVAADVDPGRHERPVTEQLGELPTGTTRWEWDAPGMASALLRARLGPQWVG